MSLQEQNETAAIEKLDIENEALEKRYRKQMRADGESEQSIEGSLEQINKKAKSENTTKVLLRDDHGNLLIDYTKDTYRGRHVDYQTRTETDEYDYKKAYNKELKELVGEVSKEKTSNNKSEDAEKKQDEVSSSANVETSKKENNEVVGSDDVTIHVTNKGLALALQKSGVENPMKVAKQIFKETGMTEYNTPDSIHVSEELLSHLPKQALAALKNDQSKQASV